MAFSKTPDQGYERKIMDTDGILILNPKDLLTTSKADGFITEKHHVKCLIVGLTEIDFIRRVQNLYKK